jgi:hypothetical protein
VRYLKFVAAVVLPLLYLSSIVSQRLGVWDWWFGLNEIEKVASHFETSYDPDVSRQVRESDLAWKPLLRLIRRYSIVTLPANRQPKVVACFAAITSAKIDVGQGRMAEWTAPTTPLVLLYQDPFPVSFEDA